ncbi:MAG: restriction endonuclease subunit S [Lachnospiraceae bacterium]|nr:restriction endonuclease subunit S [Lachnospiraceae bacterium]
MKRIDTSCWNTYKITDIFLVKNTNCVLSRDITPDSGVYPYVTASSINNGVSTYVNVDPLLLDKGNCILIGGKTLAFSYQEIDFVSNDSHNLALYLIESKYRKENVYLFLITALKASLSKSYKWTDSISYRAIQKNTILLPSCSDGAPDYNFMEKFIDTLTQRVNSDIDTRCNMLARHIETVLPTNNWSDISISQLFKVVKGTRLTKKDMREGDIPFIGASAVNNGITAYIANDSELHPANTITVAYNGSVGESFYQEIPFWASDDINVLYPKFTLTRNIAMFLIPILKKKGQNYAFIDKWNKEAMENDTIKIPVKSNGKPDFEYMSSFIETLASRSQDHLNKLSQIL